MKASDRNRWILALLLLAGPLFGALAALARMLTTPLHAATYGAAVGLPLGILATPVVFACVRNRPPWIVAAAVLMPTTIAAFVGGWNRNQYPLGSILTAVPLTAAVYIVAALVVRFVYPHKRPAPGVCVSCGYQLEGLKGAVCPECGQAIAEPTAERPEGAEGA